MNDYLAKLNKEQLAPVLDTEGAVLVIAGAGSGKTRVLTSRIAHLVGDLFVPPENVLAITFTNKAADEMKYRLGTMVESSERLWVSTIHSMSVKILRANIVAMGYTPDFTIYDDTDKERVLKRILTDMEADEKELKNAKFHISNAKNEFMTPEEFLIANSTYSKAKMYADIMREYDKALRASNALDFDDLLVKVYQLLADFPEIRMKYAERFRYIHVDEFQDTNTVQYKIIKLLASAHGNLFVVGDDDQSIYSWRGAKITNMLGFDKDFPNAKVYKLQQNYRSTKSILNLANAIIKNNRTRRKKELWTENNDGDKPQFYIAEDENGEASWTALTIKSLLARGYRPSDFAVLMRVNALSRAYEQEFNKYGIPYKVFGGFKFFERKEIKDVTAYLKLINNPLDNEALLRVINYPKRGIGEKTISIMRDYINETNLSLFDAVMDVENLPLGKGVKEKLAEFKDLVVQLMVAKETLGLSDFVKAVIEKAKFIEQFAADTEENKSKRMNIDELLNSVMEFEKINVGATLSEYLNSITLSSDVDEINEEDCVTVATIHAVKGLEYRSVFICGLDESLFPLVRSDSTQEDTEEERRLMYVAITRARENLFITRARSRFLYGDRRFMSQSVFIKELAEQLGLRNSKITYQSPYREPSFNERPDRAVNEMRTEENGGGYNSGYASELLKKLSGNSVKNDDISVFRCGQRVKHPRFGVGVIIALKGSGANLSADVAFGGVGIKTLALKFAPLEII